MSRASSPRASTPMGSQTAPRAMTPPAPSAPGWDNLAGPDRPEELTNAVSWYGGPAITRHRGPLYYLKGETSEQYTARIKAIEQLPELPAEELEEYKRRDAQRLAALKSQETPNPWSSVSASSSASVPAATAAGGWMSAGRESIRTDHSRRLLDTLNMYNEGQTGANQLSLGQPVYVTNVANEYTLYCASEMSLAEIARQVMLLEQNADPVRFTVRTTHPFVTLVAYHDENLNLMRERAASAMSTRAASPPRGTSSSASSIPSPARPAPTDTAPQWRMAGRPMSVETRGSWGSAAAAAPLLSMGGQPLTTTTTNAWGTAAPTSSGGTTGTWGTASTPAVNSTPAQGPTSSSTVSGWGSNFTPGPTSSTWSTTPAQGPTSGGWGSTPAQTPAMNSTPAQGPTSGGWGSNFTSGPTSTAWSTTPASTAGSWGSRM